jgi:FkbM family methyltransferase
MAEKAKESVLSKFLTALARLSLNSPKGRWTLSIFFLRLASRNGVTPSVYGPLFQSRWSDLTFRFCVSGYYGRYLSDFLHNFDSPFSFIDIGANIDLYSLVAARNKRCLRCYAFEPNPAVFEALKFNIEINGARNIEAINSAVSETAGMLRFLYVDQRTGAGSVARDGDDNAITVTSVNKDYFDNLAASDKQTKVVKIDVEGHEPIVIGELIKSDIWDSIEYLYFECDGARYGA